MKAHRIIIAIGLCVLLAVPLSAAAGTWKPAKPIKLIVPWGAGGSTDQVTRVCAGELEKPLGQTIVVVNQPGASGSIGTKNTLDAPRDGYTWTSGAAKDLGTYQVLGMIDTSIRDWHLFLNISLPQVVAVQADSPYKTFDDLLADFSVARVDGWVVHVAGLAVQDATRSVFLSEFGVLWVVHVLRLGAVQRATESLAHQRHRFAGAPAADHCLAQPAAR